MTYEVDRKEIKMNSQTLREYVHRHMGSTTILAALGAVLDAQVTGTPLPPTIQVRIDEVLDALGINGMTEGASAADLKQMLAEIRFNMLLDAKLLFDTTRSLAWTHTETEILQVGGAVSAGFADALTHTIVPRLDGLSQHLESPEGSFLDVGVGVAGLSISMAHLWPSLNVVGIDPWAPSLVLARERTKCRPHRPHPVTGTGGGGSFRYRRLRSSLDSQRLHAGEGDSGSLRTRMPRATSRWMGLVCEGESRYRSGDRIPGPTANGALGWLSDDPRPGRSALEPDWIR